MNNQKTSNIIGITISLVLVAILLPIGINQISQAELGYYEITSCNTPERVDINMHNVSTPYNNSFWKYNVSVEWINFEWNSSTLPTTENYSIEITIMSTNASAVNISNIQIYGLAGTIDVGNFTTLFSREFEFGKKFTTPEMPVSITSIWFNFTLDILSNSTISVNSRILQFTTNENTETISELFIVIPILAIIGVVLAFVETKKR